MDPRIQHLLALMDENPPGRLSLTVMANLVGLSSSRLRHKFKLEVGITPTVYLRAMKLRVARDLLQSNRLSVKEVRAIIGIESASYFTHQFKRVYGVPPSVSRNHSSQTLIQPPGE
jgi:transcriptional regulator GlxA family with amidase domain